MLINMLTGADGEPDVVRGLDAGANDYMAKPFSLPELLARVRAQLRTFDGSMHATLSVEPCFFSPGVRLLHKRTRGRNIRLTDREGRVLKFLYPAAGKPMTRQVLLDEVWGYNSAVATHTLETHIYRLRQNIEPNPSNPTVILTMADGYALNLRVD
jgi:DNA-binding response OmpR family regulator